MMKTIKNMNLDLTNSTSPNPSSQCTTFRPIYPQPTLPSISKYSPSVQTIENDKWQLDSNSLQLSSNISQLNNSISLTNTFNSDSINAIHTLQNLQQKITQQLLCLRQQKLTLMEEYNKITENKFKIQRQLNKIKKKINSSDNQSYIAQKAQASTKSSQFIDNRKNQYHQNKVNQEDIETAKQIVCIEEEIGEMQSCISQMQQSDKSSVASKASEQTHEPGKIKRNNRSTCDMKSKQVTIVQGVRLKREKLLKKLTTRITDQQLRQHLLSLITSNHQLQAIVDQQEYKSLNRLQLLRERVSKEQRNKVKFLEDLITLKCKCKHLKAENQELKNAFNYFTL